MLPLNMLYYHNKCVYNRWAWWRKGDALHLYLWGTSFEHRICREVVHGYLHSLPIKGGIGIEMVPRSLLSCF